MSRAQFILDSRMLDRIWNLLQDCGMPESVPHRDLLVELFYMLEEHYDEEDE